MEANTSTSLLSDILNGQFGAPVTSPPVVASAAQPTVRDWSIETIDTAGAARSAADEATCARLGLALPPAFFALGTTLVDVGVDNARLARAEFEAMPVASDALAKLEAEVRAECRSTIPIELSKLVITKTGELATKADPAATHPAKRAGFKLGLEHDPAKQLSSLMRTAIDAKGDLGVVTGLAFGEETTVEQAARTWNNYGKILAEREAKSGEAKEIVLRTRRVETAPGQRQTQIYAVTSTRYGKCDTNDIAAACRELVADMPGDVRAQVMYDRTSVAIDLVTHTNVAAESQTVGDVFRAGLRIRSDDTGGGALRLSKVAYRVACRNYTVVHADGSVTVIRHMGDPATLLEKLQQALATQSDVLRTFAAQWNQACSKQAERSMIENLETTRAQRHALDSIVGMMLDGKAYQKEQAELLDGIYRSVIERNNLAAKGDLEDAVVELRRAHYNPVNRGQASEFSPAAISNGLTLWAQGRGRHDADAIETVAGRIISGDEALAWIAAPK